jgi:hypothetical protein
MKTTLKFVAAAFGFALTNAGAQVPVVGGPVNFSAQIAAVSEAEKAIKVSSEFLVLMYDSPAKEIKAMTTDVTPTMATVTATTKTKVCELTLSKNEFANKHGWVVQNHSCKAR